MFNLVRFRSPYRPLLRKERYPQKLESRTTTLKNIKTLNKHSCFFNYCGYTRAINRNKYRIRSTITGCHFKREESYENKIQAFDLTFGCNGRIELNAASSTAGYPGRGNCDRAKTCRIVAGCAYFSCRGFW